MGLYTITMLSLLTSIAGVYLCFIVPYVHYARGYNERSASCLIQNNVFASNSTGAFTTAVYITGSANSVIENNMFISNSTALILTSSASSLIKNNEFRILVRGA